MEEINRNKKSLTGVILAILIILTIMFVSIYFVTQKSSLNIRTFITSKKPCDLKGRSIDLLVEGFNSKQDHYMKTTGSLIGAPAPGWEKNLISKVENKCINTALQTAQYSPINSIYIVNSTQSLDEQVRNGHLYLEVSNNRVIKAWLR